MRYINSTSNPLSKTGFKIAYFIVCLAAFNFTIAAPLVQAHEAKKRIAEQQIRQLLYNLENPPQRPFQQLYKSLEQFSNSDADNFFNSENISENLVVNEFHNTNTYSTYLPTEEIFVPSQVKEPEIQPFLTHEPKLTTKEGIIGVSEEFPYDSPVDNVFLVDINELPKQEEIIWLNYDVYGVEGISGVSSSLNSNTATGGYLIKTNKEWTSVKEPIRSTTIKKGDNYIRFSIPKNAGYNYKIKNVRITSDHSDKFEDIVFGEPEIKFQKEGQTYVKGIINNSSYKSLYINNRQINIDKNNSFESIVDLNQKDKERGYIEVKIIKDDNSLITKKLSISKDLQEADFLIEITPALLSVEKEFGSMESSLTAYGASLFLPFDALEHNTKLSITELRPIDIAPMESGMVNVTFNQKGFRFLPHGTIFQKEGKIAIPYDEKLIPTGNSVEDIRTYYFDDAIAHWQELELDSIDQVNKLIISKTNHFTDMINGVIQTPESPQTNAFAPTMMSDVKAANPTAGMNLMQPPSASQDGAAHLSYPIVIPPGRNGMQPNLAIQYNSEGGNSWMGLGWNINLPSITLDTRWGVPEFATHESELYLLSGEQLVYPKTNPTDDAPYLPHRHTIDGNGHYDTNNPQPRNSSGIKTFYLRKEGSFTKIERLGTSPSTYYWKVTSTDGTIFWYGGTETGISTASILKNDTGNIVHWGLKKTIDVFGNNILYEYVSVNDSGGKQLYLDKISYTGKNTTAGPYTVTFKRDTSVTRPDISIDGRLGLKRVDARRLESIEVRYNNANPPIRKYKLNYEIGKFNKSLLSEIIEYNEENVEFQRHTLKYHDDLEKEGTLFSSPKNINITGDLGDVDPNILFNIDQILPASIIGSDQSTNIGWGVSFLVGLAITGPYDFSPSQSKNKTFTLGTSFTENFSETLGMTSLIDIDGNGVKDVVYRTNSGLKYIPQSIQRNHYFNGNIDYSNTFDNKKSLMRTDGAPMYNFSYTDGYSKSKIFENFEFNSQIVNVNKKRYENHYDLQTYFSDGNGDGLPDIVDNGVVYFNRILNGQPTFNTSSFETPNLLIVAETGLSEEEYDESHPELGEKNYDAVRMWKAPFRGTIKIEDAIQILGNSNDSRLLYTVETAYLNDPNNTYRLQLLDIDNHSIHNYSLTTHLGGIPLGNPAVVGQPIQVEAGQIIFFRVHNLGESNEEIKWDPKITYLTRETNNINDFPEIDQNGRSTIESNYSTSFLLSNERTLDLPGTGTVYINWQNINIVSPSDEVHYEIIARKLNPYGTGAIEETVFFSETFTIGQNTVFSDNGGINVSIDCRGIIKDRGPEYRASCYKHGLIFRVRSDSNIKWTDLEWHPTVVYQPDAYAVSQGIPNENVTRLAVAEYTAYEMNNSENPNINSYSNLVIKPRSGWDIPNSITNYSIFPNLDIVLPSNVNGEFQMIVKKDNITIGKKKIYVAEGVLGIADEDEDEQTTFDNPIIVYSGNLTSETNYSKISVEFCATGQLNSSVLNEFAKASQNHVIIGYDWTQLLTSNKFYKSNAVNFYYDKSYHGPLISNWGQFFYNEALNEYESNEVPSDNYGKLIDYELVENPIANVNIEALLDELDLDIDPDHEYTDEELDAIIMDAFTPPGEGASEEEWQTYYNNMSVILGYAQYNPVQVASAVRSNENGKRWIGIFSHQFIKNDRSYLGDIGDIFGDAFEDQTPTAEPMQVDIETGMFGLIKKSKTASHAFLASLGIYGFGIGVSIGKSGVDGKGYNYSYTDFADINGDRYPDLVYSDKAQYTNMTGGHKLPLSTSWGSVTDHSSRTEGISFSYAPLNAGEFAFSASNKESGDGTKNNKPSVPVSATIGLEGDLGGYNQTQKYWLDLNGDGLPELIKKDQNGNYRYWLNTGHTNNNQYVNQTFNGLTQYHATPGDLSANVGMSLNLSDMFGESLPEDFNFSFNISAGAGYNFSNTETSFIDVNGDGLVDLIKLENGGQYKVYLNKGNGFDMSSSNAITLSYADNQLGLNHNSENVSFNAGIDFSFFIHPLIYSLWIIIIVAFVPVPINIINIFLKLGISAQASASVTKSDTLKTLEDFDGDGYPDFIEKDGESIKVYYSNIRRTNKLSAVENSIGGKFELDYTVEGNTYDMPSGKWVLSMVKTYPKDPFYVPKHRSKYFKYENGYYDRREREFFGFETVKTMDLNANANPTNYSQVETNAYRTQINRYHNKSYFLKGLLKESYTIKGFHNTPTGNPDYTIIPTSKLFSKTINTYELNPITNDHKRDVNQTLPFTFDTGGREGRNTAVVTLKQMDNYIYELTSTPIQSRQIFTYDEYARIKNLDFKGDLSTADDDYFSEITYHTDDGLLNNNILSVPKEIIVKSSLVSSDYLRKRTTENINLNTGAIGTIKAFYKDGTTELNSETNMTYNSDGKLATIIYPKNANNQRVQITYEYNDGFIQNNVTKVTDNLGYNSSSSYEAKYGNLLTSTDINGNQVKYKYDTYGRLIQINSPKEPNQASQYTIQFSYHPYDNPGDYETFPYAITKHFDAQNPSNPIETYTFTDGTGRVVQVKKDVDVQTLGSVTSNEKMSISGKVVTDLYGRPVEHYHPLVEAKSASLNKYLEFGYNTFEHPTTTSYDELDRALTVTLPVANHTTTLTYTLANDGFNKKQMETKSVSKQNSNTDITTYTYTDVNGRTTSVKNVLTGTGGGDIWTKYTYDKIGQLKQVIDHNGNIIESIYDLLGRRIEMTHPDAGTNKYWYDPVGNLTKMQTPNLLNYSVPATEKFIKYTYDALNRLTNITYPPLPATGNLNNVVYGYGSPSESTPNGKGKLISQRDATGKQFYEYGNMGELIKSTRYIVAPNLPDRVFVHQYEYDSWNRINKIIYPDNEQVTYKFDLGGNLLKMSGQNGSSPYDYIKQITYDHFEQRTAIKYGNNTINTYEYSPELRRLHNAEAQQSNGDKLFDFIYDYDYVGNITNFRSLTAPVTNKMGGTYSFTYSYDNLNRLKTSGGSFNGYNGTSPPSFENFSANYNLEMEYDKLNNITKKTQTHNKDGASFAANTYTHNYNYVNGKPHQIDKIQKGTSSNYENFVYDANGNLKEHTGNSNWLYLWDESNRLRSAVQNELKMRHYIYDSGGERTLKASSNYTQVYENGQPTNGGVTMNGYTTYPSAYLTISSSSVYTKHYFEGSKRVASKPIGSASVFNVNGFVSDLEEIKAKQMIDAQSVADTLDLGEIDFEIEAIPGPSDPQMQAIYYFHPDHLGSSSFITDGSGYAYQLFLNLPFGETMAEQRNGTSFNNVFKFNGKELDAETGLYYYGARYYNPSISNWLSVDPLAELTMEVYLYAGNNPVRYTDPTGMSKDDWVKNGNNWIWRSDINSEQEALDNGFSDYSDGISNNIFTSSSGEQITLGQNKHWYKGGQEYTAPDHTPKSEILIKGLADFTGGSEIAETHNKALVASTKSDGTIDWSGYSAHTLWLDKINNYGGDLGSASTPNLNRTPKSINWEGKTFSQYKSLYWSTRIKPTYQPIRMSNGKVFKVYEELHHQFIPQRAKWAPDWMKNNWLNLQPLNTIQHGLKDHFRFRFFPTEIKEGIEKGNTFGY